ncbi:MAG: restriction endonuclease [Phycisphaerales bacterium]
MFDSVLGSHLCNYLDPDPFELANAYNELSPEEAQAVSLTCPLCGWCLKYWPFVGGETPIVDSGCVAELKEFDINSTALSLEELGAYLRRHVADVYGLHWRRFEELVADVFRAHGFQILLTQQTRDGGADLIVVSKDDGKPIGIVECKRYAAERRVGISAIRCLTGAALQFDVQQAYLVTSSEFSSIAQAGARELEQRGMAFDLISCSRLLEMLQVYTMGLPSLHLLSDTARAEIASHNLARMHEEARSS